MPKKVLMIVGDFVEDYEAMVPFQILTMAGHTVHTVSPGKKPGESVKTAIHDFEGDQTYSEKRGHNFAINADFDKVKPEDYDALFVPGGRAPEYLRLNERVLEMVRHFDKANKPMGTMCHGPSGPCGRGSPRREEAHRVSGDIARAQEGRRQVGGGELHLLQRTMDGNLTSTPAWPGHPELLRAFLEMLGTKITS